MKINKEEKKRGFVFDQVNYSVHVFWPVVILKG